MNSGEQKQLTAFAGSKAIGVNPHADNPKAAMLLASFLASEESQLKRFEMRAITPAHKNLASNATVTASQVAVAEMAVMNNCSTMQPYIDEMSAFWAPMSNFGEAVMNGDITLENYKNHVDLLIGEINAPGL
jgi:arabinogalactan oligomer/maltooligosaccharide transport system substrate-binding protein